VRQTANLDVEQTTEIELAVESIFVERYWPPASAPPGNLNQLGGRPNLPAGVPWPRTKPEGREEVSLDFLAQINLADLPDVAGRGALPASGMLYFFALALVTMPLADHGPGAARVLYWPGDVGNVPPREIPLDAGWNLEQSEYAKGPAEQYRRPDALRGILFPRCPVKLRRSVGADERPEPKRSWTYRQPEHFPRRVEDAVLCINFVRNQWLELLVPLPDVLRARRKGDFDAAQYEAWCNRADAMTRALLAQGRATLLEPNRRADVRALLNHGDELLVRAGKYKSHVNLSNAATTSLATLLLDMPDVASSCAEEMEDAAPPGESLADIGAHWMLGTPRAVQGDPMQGDDPILLLQLGSDWFGPRFQWWDCGTLTFWIERRDAQAGRFERVQAEIYGH
jgi:uncharacterized protein YwqG